MPKREKFEWADLRGYQDFKDDPFVWSVIERAYHLQQRGFALVLEEVDTEDPHVIFPNGRMATESEIRNYFHNRRLKIGDRRQINFRDALEYLEAYKMVG